MILRKSNASVSNVEDSVSLVCVTSAPSQGREERYHSELVSKTLKGTYTHKCTHYGVSSNERTKSNSLRGKKSGILSPVFLNPCDEMDPSHNSTLPIRSEFSTPHLPKHVKKQKPVVSGTFHEFFFANVGNVNLELRLGL